MLAQQRTQETVNFGFQWMSPDCFRVYFQWLYNNLRHEWWLNLWKNWDDTNSFGTISSININCSGIWSGFNFCGVWEGFDDWWQGDWRQSCSLNDCCWIGCINDWDWGWWGSIVYSGDLGCCCDGFCAWNVVFFSWNTIFNEWSFWCYSRNIR